jgi:hypothetical protein
MNPIAGLTISGLRDPAYVESDHGYLYPCEGDVKTQLATLDNGFDSSKFNILLSHRPELYSLYKNHGYDLVYSGHTHGNQMGFTWTPFHGQPVFPEALRRLLPRKADFDDCEPRFRLLLFDAVPGPLQRRNYRHNVPQGLKPLGFLSDFASAMERHFLSRVTWARIALSQL